MLKNDQKISLEGATFEQLKQDFDSILNRTIGNMEMKGADEATVTLKLAIKLEKTTTFEEHGAVDVTRPTFKHDISSVMQVKDKKSGQLDEEMALVFDEASGQYVLRPIKDGQMTFDDYINGEVVDADYKEADSKQDIIEGSAVPQIGMNEPDENSSTDEIEEPFGDDDPEKSNDDKAPESTPKENESRYDWLIQFVGEDLSVVSEDGGYKVKTADGDVVLSTLAEKGDPAHCTEALLQDLVGAEVACVEYESDGKTVSVAIECEEKGVVVAEAGNPDAE